MSYRTRTSDTRILTPRYKYTISILIPRYKYENKNYSVPRYRYENKFIFVLILGISTKINLIPLLGTKITLYFYTLFLYLKYRYENKV